MNANERARRCGLYQIGEVSKIGGHIAAHAAALRRAWAHAARPGGRQREPLLQPADDAEDPRDQLPQDDGALSGGDRIHDAALQSRAGAQVPVQAPCGVRRADTAPGREARGHRGVERARGRGQHGAAREAQEREREVPAAAGAAWPEDQVLGQLRGVRREPGVRLVRAGRRERDRRPRDPALPLGGRRRRRGVGWRRVRRVAAAEAHQADRLQDRVRAPGGHVPLHVPRGAVREAGRGVSSPDRLRARKRLQGRRPGDRALRVGLLDHVQLGPLRG